MNRRSFLGAALCVSLLPRVKEDKFIEILYNREYHGTYIIRSNNLKAFLEAYFKYLPKSEMAYYNGCIRECQQMGMFMICCTSPAANAFAYTLSSFREQGYRIIYRRDVNNVIEHYPHI